MYIVEGNRVKNENIEALFRSGHEACTFAYAFNHQQYPMTIMSRLMRASGIGSGRGLVGLDGAAIAGTVKRHVEAMSAPYPAVLGARYELCQDRAMAYVVALAGQAIPALGTGGHSRRMVQELIMYYFRIPNQEGRPIKLAAVADRYGVHASTVTRAWKPVKDRLREWESRAQAEIDGRMVEVGLV